MNSIIYVLFTLCLTTVMGKRPILFKRAHTAQIASESTTVSPGSNQGYGQSRKDIVYSYCEDTFNLYGDGAIDAWLDYFAVDGFEYCLTNNTGMDLIDGRYENICWHNSDEVEQVMLKRIAFKSKDQQRPHIDHSCNVIQTGQDEFKSITVLTATRGLCEFTGIRENQHVFNQDDKFTSVNQTRENDIYINCSETAAIISSTEAGKTREEILHSLCEATQNLYSNGAMNEWLDYFADGFEYCFTNDTGMDLIGGRVENICYRNKQDLADVMYDRIDYIDNTDQEEAIEVQNTCDVRQTGDDEYISIVTLTTIGETCTFIGIMENHHVFDQYDKLTTFNVTRQRDIVNCVERPVIISTAEADTSREEVLHSLCEATQNLHSNGAMDEWLKYFADDGFEYCFTNDTGMDLIGGRVENICWRNKDDLAAVMYDRIDYIDSTDQEEAIEVQTTCDVIKTGDDEYTSITTLTTIGQSCTFTGIMENHHVFNQDDKLKTLNVTRQKDIVNCVDMPTIISTTEAPIKECEYSAGNRLMNRLQCGKGFRCNQEGNCEVISVDCF